MDEAALKSYFSFRIDEEAFYMPLDEVILQTPNLFSSPAAAFRENLQSVIATISIPSWLFAALAGDLVEKALEQIHASFFIKPVGELLRQGSVITWTALEVLANDLFVQLLNAVPDLSANLMEAKTGNRFQLKKIPLEDVARFGFNLSDKMGVLLADRQPIDSTAIMREVFDVLFPDKAFLRKALQSDRLWVLYQNRNLILHRRGVIDKTYISNTGVAANLEGLQLEVTFEELVTDLKLVRDVGIAMLQAAPSRLKIVPAIETQEPPETKKSDT